LSSTQVALETLRVCNDDSEELCCDQADKCKQPKKIVHGVRSGGFGRPPTRRRAPKPASNFAVFRRKFSVNARFKQLGVSVVDRWVASWIGVLGLRRPGGARNGGGEAAAPQPGAPRQAGWPWPASDPSVDRPQFSAFSRKLADLQSGLGHARRQP